MKKIELFKKLTINKDDAVVVAIDFQEHIVPAMSHPDALVEASTKFIKGAKILGLPIMVTQQYTRGLGETVPEIKEALGDFTHIEKTTFNCCLNNEFMEQLEALDKDTVILTGIEAHICVAQTALHLVEEGYNVYIIDECIDSRNENDKKIAEQRFVRAGATVTTLESALFEMLDSSKSPGFKEISSLIK